MNPTLDSSSHIEAASLLLTEYLPSWGALLELLPRFEGYQYEFMEHSAFEHLLQRSISRGMVIYWQEILYRAHWAACASLIRTHRWLCGLFDAFTSRNPVVFCASARGLLESSADAWYSLSAVPLTLASAKPTINQALTGQLNSNVIAEDLEDRLIHFTYARKPAKGEAVPHQHQAQSVAAYLKHLGQDELQVREYYAQLCDMVHPGATSTLSYARQRGLLGNTISLTFERERNVFEDFVASMRLTMPTIMAAGFNSGFITLYVLNAFSLEAVHTPLINSLPINRLPAVESIDELLKKS